MPFQLEKSRRHLLIDRVVLDQQQAQGRSRSFRIGLPDRICDRRRTPDDDIEGEPSYRLFEGNSALKARERFGVTPRLRFKTQDGRPHGLQVRDWGVWELMRKNSDRMAGADATEWVARSLHLNQSSVLLLGNFCNHRTAWMVISVLNIASC